MPSSLVLETARLALRPLVEKHLHELKQILAEPDVVKGLVGDISTPERLENTARIWLSDVSFWEANRFGIWGVFDRGEVLGTSEALLGVAGAGEPPPVVGEGPESYYFFAKNVWGKGVAGEAMTAICTYLFETIKVPAVEALIFAELNPGSVRVAEKLRMRPVGRIDLLGHHLSEERALETIEFELWRVRTSSSTQALENLKEAAFRVGQLIGEGVSDAQIALGALLKSARASGVSTYIENRSLRELIERHLASGINTPGCAHYRVRREEWDAL